MVAGSNILHSKLRPNRYMFTNDYRNSSSTFPTVPSSTPYDVPFSHKYVLRCLRTIGIAECVYMTLHGHIPGRWFSYHLTWLMRLPIIGPKWSYWSVATDRQCSRLRLGRRRRRHRRAFLTLSHRRFLKYGEFSLKKAFLLPNLCSIPNLKMFVFYTRSQKFCIRRAMAT